MHHDQTSAYGAFVLRLSLGLVFFSHGFLMKAMTFGFAGTAGYFQSIGYPGFFAYLVIAGETLGGLALILGVLPRVASVLLLPIAIGAMLEHVGNGWVFSVQGGGWEFPAFLVSGLIAQALLGGGAFALDAAKLLGLNTSSRAARTA
jgi:putative oxidoreductase